MKHLRKLVGLCLICMLVVVSSWAIWESGTVPDNSSEIKNSDTRVFTSYSVDTTNAEMSISGESSFLFSDRICSLYYINTTAFVANVTEPLTMTSSWTLEYSMQSSLGFAEVALYHALFDADLEEVDGILVSRTSVIAASHGVGADQERIMTFTYTCQAGETYYLGLRLSVRLTGFSSVSGFSSAHDATLTIHSVAITTPSFDQ